MIIRFRRKGLERLFATGNASGVSAQHTRRIRLILALLGVARLPGMMDAPGLRFHARKGDLDGRYAVSVSGNWRIIFGFDGEDATDVDLMDYH